MLTQIDWFDIITTWMRNNAPTTNQLGDSQMTTTTTLNAAAVELVKGFAKTNKYSYTKLVDLVFAVQEVSATKTAGKVGRPVSEKTLELRDQVATFVAETKGNKFTTADVAAKFGCNLVQAKRVLESLQNVKEAGKVPNGGRGRPFVAYVAE